MKSVHVFTLWRKEHHEHVNTVNTLKHPETPLNILSVEVIFSGHGFSLIRFVTKE